MNQIRTIRAHEKAYSLDWLHEQDGSAGLCFATGGYDNKVREESRVKIDSDILDMRFPQADLILFGASDGSVNVLTMRPDRDRMMAAHLHAASSDPMEGCVGVDLISNDSFCSVGSEGSLVYGNLEHLTQPNLSVTLDYLPTGIRSKQDQVAIGTVEGRVLLHSTLTGKQTHVLWDGAEDRVNCLAMHEHWLCSGDEMGVIRRWDLRNTLQPVSVQAPACHQGGIMALQFHPCAPHHHLISAADDGSIGMHSLIDVSEEWRMDKEWLPCAVNTLGMANSLAAASLDNGHILLWRL